MNIAKNMEAIFVAALTFAGSASFAIDALPQAQAHNQMPAAISAAVPTDMPVVVVSAKRMTDAEKRASLQAMRHVPRSQG